MFDFSGSSSPDEPAAVPNLTLPTPDSVVGTQRRESRSKVEFIAAEDSAPRPSSASGDVELGDAPQKVDVGRMVIHRASSTFAKEDTANGTPWALAATMKGDKWKADENLIPVKGNDIPVYASDNSEIRSIQTQMAASPGAQTPQAGFASFFLGNDDDTVEEPEEEGKVGHTPRHDTVQFDAVETLCYESEGQVDMMVKRVGHGESKLVMTVTSKNVNIHKDVFVPCTAQFVMEIGEFAKRISLPVGQHSEWTVEGIMNVSLSIDEGRADLGDLHTTKVYVLNEVRFPSNVPEEGVTRLCFVTLPPDFTLVFGFFKHTANLWKNEMLWGIWFKMAPGCYYFAKQFLMFMVLDTIESCEFDPDTEKKLYDADISCTSNSYRKQFLGLLSILFVVFAIADFFAARWFISLKLGGKSSRELRLNLFSTMLQFTPAAEAEFDTGKVMKICEKHAHDAISRSWLTCFSLWEEVFTSFCALVFLTYLAWDMVGLPKVLVFCSAPALMLVGTIVYCLTHDHANDLDEWANEADDAWSSFVADRCAIRPMITGFKAGHAEVGRFEAVHKKYNAQAFKANMYTHMITKGVIRLLPLAVFACYVAFLGVNVIEGEMQLSQFSVLINTVSMFGTTIPNIYNDINMIAKGYAPIKSITKMLNSHTRRKELKRRQQRRDDIIKVYKCQPDMPWAADSILIYNLKYKHEGQSFTMPPISAIIDPCQVVALVGKGSAGKTTILRILAQHFIPTTGFTAFPTRWRVRLLDAANPPFFFRGTLMENMRFGNVIDHTDDEILAVCRLFKVSDHILEEGFAIAMQGTNLSLSDAILLSLCRIMLSSVDLLLISNALDVLGIEKASDVLTVLKKFSRDRTLNCLKTENSRVGKHKKRKTIVFSSKLQAIEVQADHLIPVGDSAHHDATL